MLSWCQVLTDKSARETKEKLAFYASRDGNLLPKWILPHPQLCFSQDSTTLFGWTPSPVNKTNSRLYIPKKKKKRTYSFFTKENTICRQYAHTATPPWSSRCTLLSKQSWKQAQPAYPRDTPSDLPQSSHASSTYQNTTRACLCTKPFETVYLPESQTRQFL